MISNKQPSENKGPYWKPVCIRDLHIHDTVRLWGDPTLTGVLTALNVLFKEGKPTDEVQISVLTEQEHYQEHRHRDGLVERLVE